MVGAAEGDMEVCDLRLEFDVLAEKNPDLAPLHLAVISGRDVVVKQLLAAGASMEARDLDQRTPLHLAVMGSKDFLLAVRKQAVVQTLLLAAGVQIEARDKYGNTPLHTAIIHCNDLAVQQLLAAGANMEVEATFNGYRGTALHLAVDMVRYQHGVAVKVIKTLLAAGAELEARDVIQRTPLRVATWLYFHIPRQQQNAMEAVVHILLAAGADVNAKTRYQLTALHDAVRGGHLAMMRRLLAAGADPEARDIDGITPVHMAFAGRRPGAAAVLLQAGAWRALLSFLPEI